jgi:hypothetical protein
MTLSWANADRYDGGVQSRYSPFAARLIATLFLSALGLWFAITPWADFLLGGNIRRPYKRNRVIFVDATGWDAVAIGCVFIALGIINLALGIRGPRRIPVFWVGAGLLIATILYGAAKAVIAIASLFA